MTDQAIAPGEQIDTSTIEGSIEYLKSKYPDAIKADDREGYEGIIVDKDKLVDVAQAMHDELGFDYLSSATAVDYLGVEDGVDHLEMVYHDEIGR